MICSWYFGGLSRAEATQMLMNEKENGVFLVRDSNTIQGDYVLCVRLVITLFIFSNLTYYVCLCLISIIFSFREDERVSHYIINRVTAADGTKFRIGNFTFPDLPALLGFYRLHYLDKTPLVRPLVYSAPTVTVLETVIGKYDFDGNVRTITYIKFFFLSSNTKSITSLSGYWRSSIQKRRSFRSYQ